MENSINRGINTGILNPYRELRECIKNEDWAKGFEVAVSHFEHYGRKQIRVYCKSHEIMIDEKTNEIRDSLIKEIKRLSVSNIIFVLLLFKIINEDIYYQMRDINTNRDKLHHSRNNEGIMGRYTTNEQDKKNFRNLLNQAIKCIEIIAR